ncbi:MHS family MFS transporter [Schumannella luteola]|uniref:MFS family permease n=1 Tax=Schumannella luteola TaxID=472059 RepID=A0A852YB08_9MICO|nr:MFS transporter [Schumannella luteola]NYG98381.1 MFS family permease [Schumannella luteola]TPX05797.1 MHS family MFS transporter [Schumannella luteola]
MSSTTPAAPPRIRRAVIAGTVGTLIEWYDYALYGAAAGVVIKPLFFPDLVDSAGALAAFATFAVGFVIRPIGGIVISHIGDRIGRKPALLLSVLLMGGATVLIGALPTALSIGVAASLLLIALRLIQGFGAGAELAGSITLVAEYAPANRRGFLTALPNAATAAGSTLATLAFLGASALPGEALLDWAWRLPFLISAALFAVALYIRKRLDETPEYKSASGTQPTAPIGELLRRSPRQLIAGFLSVTGHNAWTYLLSTFSLSYLTGTLQVPATQALLAVVVATVVGFLLTPLFGQLSDRIGHRIVFAAGAIFALAFVFPMFAMIDTRNVWLVALALSAGYGLGFGCMAGAQAAFLANLFPVRYRFTGIAVTRELNGVAVAGPTPLIASALVIAGGGAPYLVGIYIVGCCLLTVLGIALAGSSRTASGLASSR